MSCINRKNKINRISTIIIVSVILVFSVGRNVRANIGQNTYSYNDNINSITNFIINKNEAIISIKANDESIKLGLIKKIDEITNNRGAVRGGITVVNTENNKTIGVAKFNRN